MAMRLPILSSKTFASSIYLSAGGTGANHNVIKRNKVISMAYWNTLGPDGMVVQGVGNKITGNTIQGYTKPGYLDLGTGTVISGNKWAKMAPPGS